MNGALGHVYTHTLNKLGQEDEDGEINQELYIQVFGEMNEMTLPSRHRIRNSNPGGLRPSILPFGHG